MINIDQSFDIAIIGSGAAGLMAANSIKHRGNYCLITNRSLGLSNTLSAQGGMQIPRDNKKSLGLLEKDIIRSGRGISDKKIISEFVKNINPLVYELEKMGLKFDQNYDGSKKIKLAGGCSEPRIHSVGDRIGLKVIKILKNNINNTQNIFEYTKAENIEKINNKFLLSCFDKKRGKNFKIETKAVICCVGGKTYHYAETKNLKSTNPKNENNDFYSALKRLGLKEKRSKLFQYHPYGICQPRRYHGMCIPETIGNYNVSIVDKFGQRVCSIKLDRFEITKKIFETIRKKRGVEYEANKFGVVLKLSNIDKKIFKENFPKFNNLFRDKVKDIIVSPILHYYLGGFEVFNNSKTKISGLFLAGEVATGLHGKNRLMGVGLLDSLVHGKLAALSSIEYCKNLY